jgi:hypothetical protein
MPLYLNPGTAMYKALVASAPPGEGAQMHAFGINLSQSAWTALTKGLGFAEIFGSLLLLLIMIGANYYQQVQITNLNPMVRQNQQMNSQMQIMRFFPVVFGLICIRLPSGLVLYYAVSALFRVGQQWMMYHYDPKVIALVAKDDRDIEVMEARLEDTERRKSKPSGPKGQSSGPPQKKLPAAGAAAAGAAAAGSSGPKPPASKPPASKPPASKPPGQAASGTAAAGSGAAATEPTNIAPQNGGTTPAKSPARMPQAKQPKPLPAGEDGAAADGNANGQVSSSSSTASGNGQRNRNRRRKGR